MFFSSNHRLKSRVSVYGSSYYRIYHQYYTPILRLLKFQSFERELARDKLYRHRLSYCSIFLFLAINKWTRPNIIETRHVLWSPRAWDGFPFFTICAKPRIKFSNTFKLIYMCWSVRAILNRLRKKLPRQLQRDSANYWPLKMSCSIEWVQQAYITIIHLLWQARQMRIGQRLRTS